MASVVTALKTDHGDVANQLLEPYGLTTETFPDELRNVRKLLFNISPRCSKSTVITVCWPCWEWLSMPWLTYMCLSYAQSLATDHSDDRRTIILSDWYQRLSGGMQLSGSKNRVTEFRNNDMGEMKARGLNANVMGGGGFRIINDDPNDVNKVDSDVLRPKTLKSFKTYEVSRANNANVTANVVVQQRTDEEDVSGYIRANDPDYIQVVIPMEAEVDEVHKFPLSGRIIKRQPGDLMHEARFGDDVIKALKRDPIIWAGQYQQRPNPAGGGIFKIQNWRLAIAPPKLQRSIISVDATFDAGETNDYAVVGPVGQTPPVRMVTKLGEIDPRSGRPQLIEVPEFQYWVPERWRDKADIDTTEQAIEKMIIKHPDAYTKLVEAKANGHAIISQMSKRLPGFTPYNPGSDSKTKRATAMSVVQKRGDIILPADGNLTAALMAMGRTSITVGEWWELHPPPKTSDAEYVPAPQWVKDFIDEHTKFPSGKHDDQVDFLAQAVNWMEANPATLTSQISASDLFSAIEI